MPLSSSCLRKHDRPARTGTKPTMLTLVSLVFALAFAGPAIAAVPETGCDRLAQPPKLSMGKLPAVSEGVSFASMRGAASLEACRQEMTDHPDEVRFVTYAGRAADKTGDVREAVRLYRIAVDKGDAVAENNLGAFYAAGKGPLPRNPQEAQRLYKLAADQGLPGAQSNLGSLYLTGQGGLPHDEKEAVRLWMLAAESEDIQAQNNLGNMYAQGRGGLRRDMQEAIRMWRLAADQGSVDAVNNLRRAGAR